MTVARLRSLALVLLVGLAVAFVLNACGDDAPPASDAADSQPAAQQSTAETAAAQADAQQAEAQQAAQQSTPAETSAQPAQQAQQATEESTAAVAELDIEISSDTLWREVFDTLSDSEQSCMRSELGADQLETALGEPVFREDDPQQWEVTTFACLAPETARALFLASIVAGMQEDVDVEFSESDLSCLTESVADLDPAAVLAASMTDANDEFLFGALVADLLNCIPNVVLTGLLGEFGLELEDLSEDEAACLQAWVVDTDWAAAIEAEDGSDESAAVAAVLNCIPNVVLTFVLSEFGAELEDLSEDEAACLQAWVVDLDWAAAIEAEDGSDESSAFAVGLLTCAPSLATAVADADDAASVQPQAAFDLEQAVALSVDQSVQGELAGEHDYDLFVFEAEQDKLYRFDVALDTLEDSTLTLFDADAGELAYNDDLVDSFASRIVWKASASGAHYIQVGGYGSGSYTLSVSVSEFVDDHADSAAGATAVAVGEATSGALEHSEDSDYFAFEAEQGRLYRIDVALDTLEDSVLALYDDAGQELAYNDDYADSLASRIDWEAPASGVYYLEVSGFSDLGGSYSVTVAAR